MEIEQLGGQEFMEGIGDKKNILFLSLELIVMMRCYGER